jgi:opacity protein-like surface antigen
MRKHLVGIAVLTALCAAPAHAQNRSRSSWAGPGSSTCSTRNLDLDNSVTVGGRASLHLFKRLWAEGDIQYGKTDWAIPGGTTKSLTLRPWAARLVYAPKLAEKTSLLIGGGYQQSVYIGRTEQVTAQLASKNEYEDTFTGLIGLKQCLNEKWSLRGDIVGVYAPSPNQNSTSGTLDGTASNYGLRAGLGYMANGTCYTKPVPPPPPRRRRRPPAAAAAKPMWPRSSDQCPANGA